MNENTKTKKPDRLHVDAILRVCSNTTSMSQKKPNPIRLSKNHIILLNRKQSYSHVKNLQSESKIRGIHAPKIIVWLRIQNLFEAHNNAS